MTAVAAAIKATPLTNLLFPPGFFVFATSVLVEATATAASSFASAGAAGDAFELILSFVSWTPFLATAALAFSVLSSNSLLAVAGLAAAGTTFGSSTTGSGSGTGAVSSMPKNSCCGSVTSFGTEREVVA